MKRIGLILFLLACLTSAYQSIYDNIEFEGKEIVSINPQVLGRASLNETRVPCTCNSQSCSCCNNINLSLFKFNKKACFMISYDPERRRGTLTTTLNQKVIFQKNISSVNAPPICFPVVQVPGLVICALLTDLAFESSRFQVCLSVQIMAGVVPLIKLNFDCIEFTYDKGLQVVKPTKSPYRP